MQGQKMRFNREQYGEFKKFLIRSFFRGVIPTVNYAMQEFAPIIAKNMKKEDVEYTVKSLFKLFIKKNWLERTDMKDKEGNNKYMITEHFFDDCDRSGMLVFLEDEFKSVLESHYRERQNRSVTDDDRQVIKYKIKKGEIADVDDKVSDKVLEKEQQEAEKISL